MTPNSIIVLILAATAVAQYELEYSFFEPGAELRRRYQIHEQRPHVMLTCTENTVIAEVRYRGDVYTANVSSALDRCLVCLYR